ncbi:hypothetical protein [Pseudophaeobacter leonis]|uniref:hypothetical protein n=1 Tax=Pseudophaeobacter leonis TaxID=1144477 RepID=UPI0009F58A1B|nr:hypothetical protein [Pseudophaeobacter leonis]
MSFKMIEPEEISAAKLVSSTVLEDDHPEWDAGADYAAESLIIVKGDTHSIFKASAASGPGNGGAVDPVTDTEKVGWVVQTSTNRWKAFDNYIGDPTVQPEAAEWVIQADGMVDSVALFGVSAATVSIVVTDSDVGEVYNQTHILQDETGVVDAYSYFFSPIIRIETLVVTDIPPFFAPTVTITVSQPGGAVEVGQIVIGRKEVIGDALDQVPLGLTDFSRKERDDFGRYAVQERDSADLMTVAFSFQTSAAAYLRSRLKSRRAKLTVFAADSRFRQNDYAVYGFFQNFQPIARYADTSEGSIELESIV